MNDAGSNPHDGAHENGWPVEKTVRSNRLVRRPDVVIGDPDDLVDQEWSAEWRS